MEYSVSERIEISDAKTNTFENFGLIVAAFSETIRVRHVEAIKNQLRPIVHCGYASLKFFISKVTERTLCGVLMLHIHDLIKADSSFAGYREGEDYERFIKCS